MSYRKDLNAIGIDLCESFVNICKDKKLNVQLGNILNIPFDTESFDNCMSIAVIHHLDKFEDRVKALSELLRITKPGGTRTPF